VSPGLGANPRKTIRAFTGLAGRESDVKELTADEIAFNKKLDAATQKALQRFNGVRLTPSEIANVRRKQALILGQEIRRQAKQKSDFTLRTPTSFGKEAIRKDEFDAIDGDANFQSTSFDSGLGRGRNPGLDVRDSERDDPDAQEAAENDLSGDEATDDRTMHGTTCTPADSSQPDVTSLKTVFQSFGVSGEDYIGTEGRPGISFGLLHGVRPFVPRKKTRTNWWAFNPESLRIFLQGIVDNSRRGRKAAKRAAIVLHSHYALGQEDRETRERYPKLFQTINEIKTLRKRLFKEGCEMFGPSEADFGMFQGRSNDLSWEEFRKAVDSISPKLMRRLQDHAIGISQDRVQLTDKSKDIGEMTPDAESIEEGQGKRSFLGKSLIQPIVAAFDFIPQTGMPDIKIDFQDAGWLTPFCDFIFTQIFKGTENPVPVRSM